MREWREKRKIERAEKLVQEHVPPLKLKVHEEATLALQIANLQGQTRPTTKRREPMPIGERISIARMANDKADPDPPDARVESAESDAKIAETVNRDTINGFNAKIEAEKKALKKALEKRED